MKTRTAACAALLALTATLTACSGGDDAKADPAACKTAMRKQLKDAIDAGATATPGTHPSQCDAIATKTLEKYAGELMADQVGAAVNSALPEAITTTGVSPECRAWIEGELRSTGGGVDATEGVKVCGNLPEDELNQAIEDVTNSLLTATPTP
ncbi:hypothetical protein [Streptomyces resistomycificus]|uniref:hypothetical protein n=1 Tax=Streptomyces resistomycificus TaxID=67356 RepID=UPI000689CE9D|nr:hypothetical protein [Streptomyces resistomycificus]KUN93926.1 hypothetical protein AQJ84_28830 [Streptomyces resistomycificus]